jgi:tubulin epsilon
MNGLAANLLLHLTSSIRFEGTLNTDLNDITMNLVGGAWCGWRWGGG